MSIPIAILSTDLHAKTDNVEQVKDLIQQKIKLGEKLQVKTLIVLGDIFDSRQAQPLIVLQFWEEILDLIYEAGMNLICIPGNHDKTDYSKRYSFLGPFKHHPAFTLMDDYDFIKLAEGLCGIFIPYFEEDKWLEYFQETKKYLKNEKYILFSHQALTGSVNNDGSKIENSLKPSIFEKFFKVFLGHYHNQQKIGKNIYHIPSIQANNFGEDNEKGFTVLYDDGSHELIHSEFKQYYTLKVDLDKISKDELNDLKKDGSLLIKESGANVRFKFEGSEDKVSALQKEEYTALGIDVKKEHKTIVKSIQKAETGEVIVYNNETILKKFDSFCEEESYDNIEYGKNCLLKKLTLNGQKN